jgi:hypothetical protein
MMYKSLFVRAEEIRRAQEILFQVGNARNRINQIGAEATRRGADLKWAYSQAYAGLKQLCDELFDACNGNEVAYEVVCYTPQTKQVNRIVALLDEEEIPLEVGLYFLREVMDPSYEEIPLEILVEDLHELMEFM